METLTAQQAKQVIEYFAQQAAEDAPSVFADWREWDKHVWVTRMQISLAIEKQVVQYSWESLLEAMKDWQSFDRDAGAYLHELGYEDTAANRDLIHGRLEDLVSWKIDVAYDNSGA